MKISTFTIVCGNARCNARCPCCVSKMTPPAEDVKEVNWRNFGIACQFAKESGANTALITGKGEPTLAQSLLGRYIREIRRHFCFIELQTNGIIFEDAYGLKMAKEWYDAGLTLVSISILHPYVAPNSWAMRPNGYPYNPWKIAKDLQEIGLSIRMNLTMTTLLSEEIPGMQIPCSPLENFRKFIDLGRDNEIEQLTARPVNMPDDCDNAVAEWVRTHSIKEMDKKCEDWLIQMGATPLLNLGHGATVYDCKGQNICINNCLTESESPNDIRQLIFMPNGGLFYSWQYKGARIL